SRKGVFSFFSLLSFYYFTFLYSSFPTGNRTEVEPGAGGKHDCRKEDDGAKPGTQHGDEEQDPKTLDGEKLAKDEDQEAKGHGEHIDQDGPAGGVQGGAHRSLQRQVLRARLRQFLAVAA